MFIPGNKHFIGYLVGMHEEHIAGVIERSVARGSVCLDVGANIGYFTAQMAWRAGGGGRVLCYEPDAANFSVLSENAKLASESTGCSVIPAMAAVSSAPGTLQLMQGEECTGHQVRNVTGSLSTGDLVKAVTLDEECSGVSGEIALAKIDVEGHECDVLKGSAGILARRLVRTWILEISPGADAVAIGEFLRGAGYRVSLWLDGSWREFPLDELPYRTDLLAELPG
jgi:FkbM family methyltransferase